jgi:hypothetical protein
MMTKEIGMPFKPWDQMTTLEQYGVTYSDMFKDAYGFRPTNDVSDWTEADFEAEFDRLGARIGEQEDQREQQEAQAIKDFEERVESVMQSFANCDRETALRYIMEADDCNGDWDYLCYQCGLPYGYFQTVA